MQWVVAGWARTLRDTSKAAGGDVLVTLGQDEGGTGTRPAQQLHDESVDYTAIHTWWNNDGLLWDGVVTKVPEKANLHQETGLMRLEDLDGNPWRFADVSSSRDAPSRSPPGARRGWSSSSAARDACSLRRPGTP